MTNNEFHKFCKGKIGEIYIARQGTVTVFIIDGNDYLINNGSGGGVVINPARAYWERAIDWAGGFSDYFTYQMCPPNTMTYPNAKPIVDIEDKYLEKLKSLVNQ